MEIIMAYGQTGLPLDLPDDWEIAIVRKKPMPIIDEPGEAVRKALRSSAPGPSLAQAAAGCRRACILICDLTRPVPNGLILPVVVRELLAAGLKPEDIIILVATGLHRPNEGQELEELIGSDWVLKTVTIDNHFAGRDEDHVDLGPTGRGTPIKLDRRFVTADFRLVIGLVEPHFMAGYSGGRKVVVPGIAHRETIARLHSAELLESSRAANLILEGNPLHMEQMEIVKKLDPIWAVNVVIDEKRHLSFVNFGRLESSHMAAVEFIRPLAEIPLPSRYQTVVTSSAGYPLDLTYYQTVKGMVGAMDVLLPGGRLFIASSCNAGLGSAEYAEAQARLVRLGPEGFRREILKKTQADIDEWQTQMQLRPMRLGRISLYTKGLSPAERALTGVELIADLEMAIKQWVAECGDHRVVVIPEGPYVVPIYRPST